VTRRPRRRSRAATRSGHQTPIEVVLILPILAVLPVGVLDGGRIALMQNAVARAAVDCARYATAADGSPAAVRDWVRKHIPTISDAGIDVWCARDGDTVASCKPEDVLTVRVHSEVLPLTPVVSELVGPLELEGTSRAMVPR
jgi:hypothetical protein